ncbi:hypothetical protein L208DRAFT_1256322, partial [Tricholoma matsutake]
ISIFDGLLPEPHNTYILKLLFELAHWHGLAKLSMHTDATLDILSHVTTSLGNSLHTFEEKTCEAFETRELECECAAQQQHQEKSTINVVSGSRGPMASNSNAQKQKKLNLRTYKYHALSNYVDTIWHFGTTDSYSTQSVSFYMIFCVTLLTVVVGIRASSSTERPKLSHFGLVADQYHSKY